MRKTFAKIRSFGIISAIIAFLLAMVCGFVVMYGTNGQRSLFAKKAQVVASAEGIQAESLFEGRDGNRNVYGYSGGNLNGFYFSMPTNAAPYNGDWSVSYKPLSADNVKLTRNGVTNSIGCTDKGTITKFGETSYYFGMESEKLGDLWPMQVGDVLTISGSFIYGGDGTIINIPETTATIYEKTILYSSDTVVNAGTANNCADSGRYFSAAENAAPVDSSWGADYAPLTADAVQRIRGGEITNVATAGMRTIIKFEAAKYYFDNIGDVQEGDIFIVKGLFKGTATSNNTYVLNFEDSVFIGSSDGNMTGTTMVKMVGVVNSSETGKYFNTETDNGAPHLTSWGMDYVQLTTDAVKRIRNGVAENVAVVGARTIIKQGAVNYYFESATSDQDSVLGTGNSNIDLQEGDILVLDGLFKGRNNDGGLENDTYVLNFDEVRFYVGSNSNLSVMTEVDGGTMSSHSDGYGYSNGSLNGFHFNMPANGAAYNSNWSVAYKPTSADNVKLTRNGVTTSIGQTTMGTITKFGETGYYFGMESEKLGDLWPMQVGDVITISGGFIYNGTVINMPETTATIYEKTVLFSSDTVVEMNNIVNSSETGTYFNTEADNGAPYNTSWSIDYVPLTSESIKRIRNGVTENVAVIGARTIIKQGATNYYLETGTSNGSFDIAEGDILVINGLFKGRINDGGTENDTCVLKFNEVCFYVGSNNDLSIMTEVDGGAMSSHSDGYGYSNGSLNGFHFNMPTNGAPYNSNWSISYKPMSADNVKLTRNGVTTSIGQTTMGTITKFGETGYYFGMESEKLGDLWPMQVGDVITISGGFIYNGTVINMTETTATIYEKAVLFSSDAVVDVNDAISTSSSGTHFDTATDNGAPYLDSWGMDYVPLTTDSIKRIRNGVTENVAVIGARTIIKFGATNYFLETTDNSGSNIDLQAGDIVVIEGLFKGRCNDGGSNNDNYVLRFAETRFYVGNDKALATIATESVKYDYYDLTGSVLRENAFSDSMVFGNTSSENFEFVTHMTMMSGHRPLPLGIAATADRTDTGAYAYWMDISNDGTINLYNWNYYGDATHLSADASASLPDETQAANGFVLGYGLKGLYKGATLVGRYIYVSVNGTEVASYTDYSLPSTGTAVIADTTARAILTSTYLTWDNATAYDWYDITNQTSTTYDEIISNLSGDQVVGTFSNGETVNVALKGIFSIGAQGYTTADGGTEAGFTMSLLNRTDLMYDTYKTGYTISFRDHLKLNDMNDQREIWAYPDNPFTANSSWNVEIGAVKCYLNGEYYGVKVYVTLNGREAISIVDTNPNELNGSYIMAPMIDREGDSVTISTTYALRTLNVTACDGVDLGDTVMLIDGDTTLNVPMLEGYVLTSAKLGETALTFTEKAGGYEVIVPANIFGDTLTFTTEERNVTVTLPASEDATVVLAGGGNTIAYGGVMTIQITPKTGLGISVMRVNGIDVTAEVTESNGVYEYTAYCVKEDVAVEIEYAISVELQMLEGASVRTTAPAGLRFIATISEAEYNRLISAGYTVSFGMLIAPEDTVIAAGALTKATDPLLDISCDTLSLKSGYYEIRGAMVNMYEHNYSRNFVGRAYVDVTIDGVTYTKYADYYDGDIANNTRSVYEVAAKALLDEDANLSDNAVSVLEGFIEIVHNNYEFTVNGEVVTVVQKSGSTLKEYLPKYYYDATKKRLYAVTLD